MTSTEAVRAQRWAKLPERGTPAAVRLLAWIALRIGRPAARLLLYPVTCYFVISSRTARRVSFEYLQRVRGRRAHCWNVFRHFHCFAATILDRVYLLRGNFKQFDIAIHQKEMLQQFIDNNKAGVLLGSHLGSFEVLRTLGLARGDFSLKVIMDPVHNENITRLFDGLNPEIADTVIVADRPDMLLRAKESLETGSFIGILGDRVSTDGKTVPCQFLGGTATFPAGPFLLASMLHCPVILFFGLYRGGNRYEIYFEHFADEIILSRDRRMEDVRAWAQRYAARLEHYARLAPYNWFNFYPFWD